MQTQQTVRFDGSDYVPILDKIRLSGQMQRIYDCMKNGTWKNNNGSKAWT